MPRLAFAGCAPADRLTVTVAVAQTFAKPDSLNPPAIATAVQAGVFGLSVDGVYRDLCSEVLDPQARRS